MSKPTDLFHYLDKINFIYGVSLKNHPSKISRIFNILNRYHLIVLLIIMFILKVFEMYSTFGYNKLEYFSYYWISWYYIYLFTMKKEAIKELIRAIRKHMTDNDLITCLPASKRYFYYMIILYLMYFPNQQYHNLDMLVRDRLEHVPQLKSLPYSIKLVLLFWRSYIMVISVNLGSLITFIYIYFLRCIDVITTRFLTNVTNNVKLHKPRLIWREICDTRDMFECLFNAFPFIKFSVTFLQTTTYILYFDHASLGFNFNTSTVVYSWLLATIQTLSIITTIEQFNQKYQVMFKALSKKYLYLNDSQTKSLIDDIEKHCELKLSACSLFVINNGVILNFISALISFSVLFVQIESIKQK